MLASIQRIVRAEGQASGSPRDPDFETVGSFPLTVNDPATTDRVAAAFATHFGDHALEIDRQTVSEDFSNIPDAASVPYTYWGMGFTDEKTYRAAEKAGRLQDLPTNHSPKFLPPLQPTLRTGTEALVAAALAWLAKLPRTNPAPADLSLHAAARSGCSKPTDCYAAQTLSPALSRTGLSRRALGSYACGQATIRLAALCPGGRVNVRVRPGEDGHLGAALVPGRWLHPTPGDDAPYP